MFLDSVFNQTVKTLIGLQMQNSILGRINDAELNIVLRLWQM